jgi:hypothetical protein
MDLYGCEPFMKKIEEVVGMISSTQYQEFLQQAGMVTPVPPQPIFTGLLERG